MDNICNNSSLSKPFLCIPSQKASAPPGNPANVELIISSPATPSMVFCSPLVISAGAGASGSLINLLTLSTSHVSLASDLSYQSTFGTIKVLHLHPEEVFCFGTLESKHIHSSVTSFSDTNKLCILREND